MMNGDPISDRSQSASQVTAVASGSTFVTDAMIDDWSDTLSADDYGFSFNTIGMKEVIIENLQSNKLAALNKIEGRLNPFWILLDNQSTVHVFFNTIFLRNVRKINKELHLYTNAGKSIIDEMGDLPGFGPVWVHRNGIANILSFHAVKAMEGYSISYDSKINDIFKVEKPDGSIQEFNPSAKGLYYADFSKSFTKLLAQAKRVQFKGTQLEIHTTTENKAKFSKQDVIRAEAARALQHTAGHLSDTQLMRIAQRNQLKNCPITPRDVRLMKEILGPSIPGLKGKTV